jgi:hypothetical protein
MMKIGFKLAGCLFIGVNIVLSAWSVLHGDIVFHTDIARDFLLFEDIVYRDPIALIGPRSGGIPGVFHGPLWLYMQIPAFLIGSGNPVVVGWFWVILSALLLGITYFVARKIFNAEIALVATLLVSILQVNPTRELFNPFLAVFLSPVFLYFLWSYLKSFKIVFLLSALFTLGLIIQGQMAFGVPLLVLLLPYLVWVLYKQKKLQHLLAFFILIIPLSTFILFELKHSFLQTTSVIKYITGQENSGKMPYAQLIPNRLKEIGNSLHIAEGQDVLNLIGFGFLAFLLYRLYKKKDIKNRLFYDLYFYFFFGFWALAFLFRGVIWGYYYWPFLPLTMIIFASLSQHIPKKLFYIFFICVLFYHAHNLLGYPSYAVSQIGKDSGSWQFNWQLAQTVFKEGKNEFGYYIYTPDLFGYSPRYAMNYAQRQFQTQEAYPFQKKAVTYLISAPAPSDKPGLSGTWWGKNQVKIDKKPTKVYMFPNGFRIERYELTPEEQKIPSDPDLNISIHFR